MFFLFLQWTKNENHMEILLMCMNHFLLLRCFTFLHQLQFLLNHFYQPATFEIGKKAINAWGKLWDLTLSSRIFVLAGWKTSLNYMTFPLHLRKIYTIFFISISQWNNCLNKLLWLLLVFYWYTKATISSCPHFVIEW